MSLKYVADSNGRNHIVVKNKDGSSITVYEQGAHLVSWKNSNGEEMLYMSPKAVFEHRQPLRGGVQLIFPQFSNRGKMNQRHGFARLRQWRIRDISDGVAVFEMLTPLDDLSVDASKHVEHAATNLLVLTYTITFNNDTMTLKMNVENRCHDQAAKFSFAFMPYLKVQDVASTIVNGVNITPFVDSTKDKDSETLNVNRPVPLWVIKDELDRIYPNQGCAVLLMEPQRKVVTHISTNSLRDVAVWNPGPERCAQIPDLPENGYKEFISVGHGNILNKVTVPAQNSWNASQRIQRIRNDNESKL